MLLKTVKGVNEMSVSKYLRIIPKDTAGVYNFAWLVKKKLKIDRKEFVSKIIKTEKPLSILEVGARSGILATRMLNECQKLGIKTKYVGVDLFAEMATMENLTAEVSQWPEQQESLLKLLQGTFPTLEIVLIGGFSQDTLPNIKDIKFDLIIIDGGHSYETVLSDWSNCEKLINVNGSIIFDDYTDIEGEEKGGIGVRKVIENNVDMKIWEIKSMSTVDTFKHEWGVLRTRMVQVKSRV